MTEIRTTGVYVIAECALRLTGCRALEASPVTVVKLSPSGQQVFVCGNCLKEMLDRQEWQLVGAGLTARYDFVLLSKSSEPLIVLEVKRPPAGVEVNELEWVQSYVGNLVAHGSLHAALAIVSVLDGMTYLWRLPDRGIEPRLVGSVETRQALADLELEAPPKGLDERFGESYYSQFIENLLTVGVPKRLPWLDGSGIDRLPVDGATIRSEMALSA